VDLFLLETSCPENRTAQIIAKLNQEAFFASKRPSDMRQKMVNLSTFQCYKNWQTATIFQLKSWKVKEKREYFDQGFQSQLTTVSIYEKKQNT